jgi:hypothetical protein
VALQEHLKIVTCVLEVDGEGRVVEAEFSTVVALTNRFLGRLLQGCDLRQGFEPLAERVRAHCHLHSLRAFLKALEGAYRKWEETQGPKS